MSDWRDRSATYLGLRKATEGAEPDRRPSAVVFAVSGAAWGVLMFLLMPLMGDRQWGWGSFALWLVVGVVGFGGLSYLVARRSTRVRAGGADGP
jgi:hypothetical protein